MNSYSECKPIVELDLAPIKLKLMHKESGEGWTLEQASAVEVEYRRFLHLAKVFPDETLAPSEDVDTFWHYHILDTRKYARDCEEVFGYFLHHFPYAGLRGEDDLDTREQIGERMAALYERTFAKELRWSLISETMPFPSEHGIAAPTGAPKAKSAYCLLDGGGTGTINASKAKAAYCLLDGGGIGTINASKATPAYCLLDGGGTGAINASKSTAYCLLDGGGTGTINASKATPAYCLLDGGGTGISMDPAETVEDDHILMNMHFLTRPRFPTQAIAN